MVKNQRRTPSKLALMLVACALLFVTACDTLEVGIERTVTPDPSGTAAVVATVTQEASRFTRQPTLSASATPSLQENPSPERVGPPPGLVYQVGPDLWKVDAEGESLQIFSHVFGLAISPRGDAVLYWDSDTNDVWLADLNSGLRRNLTNTPDDGEILFRWWPGRPDVVLFGALPRETAPEPGWTGFLGLVDVDGGGYSILDDQHQIGGPVAPAPDGQTIAYGGGGTGWLYHSEAGLQVFDPADYGLTVSGGSLQISSPAWSPDGHQLAWVVSGEGLDPRGSVGIALFDLEQKTSRLLHPYEPPGMDGWPPLPLYGPDGRSNIGGWLTAPLWSPDGRWLAFVTLAQNPVKARLWILQADGQGEQEVPVAVGRIDGLAWSPDGRWLIFSLTTELLESSTWKVEAGTWARHQVDLPPGAVVLDWLEIAPK